MMDGGDGMDCLFMGSGDMVIGGVDVDVFVIGVYVDVVNVFVVMDFISGEDVFEVEILSGVDYIIMV